VLDLSNIMAVFDSLDADGNLNADDKRLAQECYRDNQLSWPK
jgi:hypothetical protein